MATKKYDWPKIKNEYFISEEQDFKTFWESTYGSYTGHVGKMSLGWRDEKVAWREKVAERTLKELEDTEVIENQKAIKRLMKAVRSKKFEELAAGDVSTYWKIMMTMVGEPTNISKTESTVKDERETPDVLTEAEREAIEKATRHFNTKSND